MKNLISQIEELEKSQIIQDKYNLAIKILLVVATDTERDAVIKQIRPLPSHNSLFKCFDGSLTFYLGVIGCFPICLVKTTMIGSLKRDASFATVSEALKLWDFKIVIMPGIAFGRYEEKQRIGDVLISETLSQYETVKEDKDGLTITRGHSVPASSVLLNRFSQESYWNDHKSGNKVKISRCELLSGEKLVNDSATKTSLFNRFPNAKGGEMEGNGVYAACDKNKVDWIICKSICDWADGNKDDQWQRLAANNAIGYVSHILSNRTSFNELGIASIFNEEIEKIFYGEGIDYNNILGMDIVSIIFPNHKIIEYPQAGTSLKRIHYEFIEVQLTVNLTICYLFLAKDILIDQTIGRFLKEQSHNYQSLVICSPRVKSDISGKDNYRLANIEKKFQAQVQAYTKFNRKIDFQFTYLEDLSWDSCMASSVLPRDYDIPDEKYFIDQEISYSNENDKTVTEKSLQFFSSVIETDSVKKPLIAVLGGAGVGKTTLCDQLLKLIGLNDKKKAIYISSSDVEGTDSTGIVNTITDLYKLAYTETIDQDEDLLDSSNLKVNISCGNIIIIIDGIDEIESKLKDKFIFESFISDAVQLNSSYNNCTIIMTSRDFYKSKYENNTNILLLQLLGFDEGLAEQYFTKRVSGSLANKATSRLRKLDVSENGYYPPVILSLVCDIIEAEQNLKRKTKNSKNYYSKYLISDNPFDSLIIKIIDREIERQSLSMAIDDVIDLLFEIASTRKGEMLKDELNEYIQIYVNDNDSKNFDSFYVNPLFLSTHNNKIVSFRYDNLILVLRSRRFNYYANQGLSKTSFIKKALLEFYDGNGDLLRDIIVNNTYSEETLIKVIGDFITELAKNREHLRTKGNIQEITNSKKYVSAILYYFFGCFPNFTRAERAEKLLILFSGRIDNLFIYGDFYPIDFKELKIYNSAFFNYKNFEKSFFPVNTKVFYNTIFEGIEPEANLDADMNVFDDSCNINAKLKHAIVKGEDNKSDLLNFIKADFILLFNVLYKNRMFVGKSEKLFINKKNKIYPKLAIDDYISFFIEKGVFERERSHSKNTKYHYKISKNYMNDIRYLITNNNFRSELEQLFRDFIFKHFGIDY